ncbi:FtsX-like permease family protein [Dyadobacter sp. 676]|uniref:FtsX-like permease family protein n=1 Tax=Dyadobacter sp. 676 TaxID=3088362 RepID=A0AAU8FRZ0_9BACT
MFKFFLRIAARRLWQGRLYACINVAGMAIGTCCMLFALLYTIDERGFDRFHQTNPYLYRITSTYHDHGETTTSGGTGQVQGPAFKAQIPELMHYTRVMGGEIYGDVRYGHRAFRLQLLFVDSSFFNVFSFKMLHGSARNALQDVGSVVITKRTALKFFNRTDVLGEMLHIDADPSAMRLGKPLVIAGVTEDPPANSSIQFDILFPFGFMKLSFDDASWLNAYLGTFVVLRPDADPGLVIRKFNQIASSLSQKQRKDHPQASPITYSLQKMTDIHLNGHEIPDQHGESGIVNTGKLAYSYIFTSMAGFILLIASINFVNLQVALSMKRAREIGIRKATGSGAKTILVQLLGESALVIGLAMAVAFLLVFALLPSFNYLAQKQIPFHRIWDPALLGWTLCIFPGNILCAAFYPAWLLSRLNPVETLNSNAPLAGKNPVGNFLMVFQFATAILLGISTLVYYRQMHFIRSKNLGYNPDQIVKIDIAGNRDANLVHNRFVNELAGDPAFRTISLTGEFGNRDVAVNGRKVLTNVRTIDTCYLPMLEMKLIQGRNFSPAFTSDEEFGVLVNQAFVKEAGIYQPVGKTIIPDDHFGKKGLTIVGVVGDFHFNSLKERIGPMIMPMSTYYGGGALWIKIAQNRESYAIEKLEKTFKSILPDAVFSYTFLHDSNASAYATELRWQQIITRITLVSVIICSLGLFGLAHLAIAQRRRETGIRIILGATGYDIAFVFFRKFIPIIVLAALIATIAGNSLMRMWLGEFAYHTDIPWWAFACPGTGAFGLALLTVAAQAMQAAAVNPVTVLRSE